MAKRKAARDFAYSEHQAFIAFLKRNKIAAQNFAGALGFSDAIRSLSWYGDMAVPPGSPAHDILEAFKRHTDISLDLAWQDFLSHMSAYFLTSGTVIQCSQQTITPELWLVVLAPSGGGKSFSMRCIGHGAPQQPTLGRVKSGAAFIEALKENEDAGRPNVMLVDEFGQMLKQMETPGDPMAELKEYLLLVFDGSPVERRTVKNGTIRIEDTKLSFLGLNVDETFYKILSAESLLDGFSQRLLFTLAKRDPERAFYNFPRYETKQILEVVEAAWERIKKTPLHPVYTYTPEAIAAYDKAFNERGMLIDREGVLNPSFFRRILQATHKLALCYHIILGKETPEIDAVDVHWAMRQTDVYLMATADLIMLKNPDIADAFRALKILDEKEKKDGRRITKRVIQRNCAGAKDGPVADGLFEAYRNAVGIE